MDPRPAYGSHARRSFVFPARYRIPCHDSWSELGRGSRDRRSIRDTQFFVVSGASCASWHVVEAVELLVSSQKRANPLIGTTRDGRISRASVSRCPARSELTSTEVAYTRPGNELRGMRTACHPLWDDPRTAHEEARCPTPRFAIASFGSTSARCGPSMST